MLGRAILKILPAIIFICAWQWFVGGNSRLEFLFGSPQKILEVAASELSSLGEFWPNVEATFLEAIIGLVIGVFFGTIAALILSVTPLVAYVSRPYITILSAVPVFALAPMLIIWFGVGLLAKVFIVSVSVFFVTQSYIFERIAEIDKQFGEYARSLGASRINFLKYILFPGVMRWIASSLKANVPLAFFGAFVSEFVSSDKGIGHYILKAGGLYDVPRLLFGVIVLAIMALVTSRVLR